MPAIVCYAHAQAPIAATCSDCTRGLCKFCGDLVQPPLCAECLEQRARTLRSRIVERSAYAALFASAAAWCAQRVEAHPSVWPSVAASYLAASALYGADSVRRHIPTKLRAFPVIGRLLYTLAWWASALIVGTFTFPFLAGTALVEAHRTKRLSAMVQRRLHPPTPARILSVRVES